MRRVIFALVAALCLLSTFTVGASAHSVQAHSVQRVSTFSTVQKITPNIVSGGGCSQYRTNSTRDISVQACISYKYPYLNSDGYASFLKRPGTNGVANCSVKIVVWRTDGVLIDNSYVQNCSVQASRNTFGAHFGPDSLFDVGFGFSYYCYLQVRLEYNNTLLSNALSPNSPNQSI